MQIRIRTLTPIWTGDINGRCIKLRETSILGSLRWWFEAIVRGFDGYACDPTSNRKDEKCEYKNDTNDICAVCELFGTTGWAKRFKFEIKQSFREIYEDNLVISGSGGRRWYYSSGLISCNSVLNTLEQILPFELKDKNTENLNIENNLVKRIFNVLFTFISEWGMIGGKTAIGYGIVRFEDESGNYLKANNEDIEKFFKYLKEKKNCGKNAKNAPRLDEMFFAKFKINEECIDKIIKKVEENISVRNGEKLYPKLIFRCNGAKEDIDTARDFLLRLKDCYGFIPTSALVRRELRSRIRNNWKNNNKLRHFLMGNVQTRKELQETDPTRFSAIQISHIYWNGENWEFRMWGWIPKDLEKSYGVSRNDVVNFIKNILNDGQFWESVFGNLCVIEKTHDMIVVEYSNKKWNFIDLGKFLNCDEVKKAFEKMLIGGEND